MGNTLITANDNRNIRQDTLLGKEISKILREKRVIFDKDLKDGKIIDQPVNQIRACCLDIVKENPGRDEFITVKLPEALDENNQDCKNNGRCIGTSDLGLQFPFKREEKCSADFKQGSDGICDNWIVNKCAKELYDAGCLKVKKNSKGNNVRVWDTENKNCFNSDGELIYGSEECVCVNSSTGFNLNNDPSKTIKGGIAFTDNYQNPYGINGTNLNNFTKYSLNVFGYDQLTQQPQLFDNRCISRINNGSAASGKSNAYLLDDYKNTELSICLNQINVKDSALGEANFSNIKQNNNCNSLGKPKIKEEETSGVVVDDDNKVDKREGDRLEDAAKDILDKQNELEALEREKTIEDIKNQSEQQKKEKEDLIEDEVIKMGYEQRLKDHIEEAQAYIFEKDEQLKESQNIRDETSTEYNKTLRENKILEINNQSQQKKLDELELENKILEEENLANKENLINEQTLNNNIDKNTSTTDGATKSTDSATTSTDSTTTSTDSTKTSTDSSSESFNPTIYILILVALILSTVIIFYLAEKK